MKGEDRSQSEKGCLGLCLGWLQLPGRVIVRRLAVLLVVAVLGLSMATGTFAQVSVITTVAGGGPVDIPALSAGLGYVASVAVDPTTGDLVVAGFSYHQVYRVSAATGRITTIAGTGAGGGFSGGYSPDGTPAVQASLAFPRAVLVEPSGDVLVAESGNGLVRRISVSTGLLTTVAGCVAQPCAPGDGGLATETMLGQPSGLARDPATGDLLIADSLQNRVRRVVLATGLMETEAGGGALEGENIAATAIALAQPEAVTVDPATGDLLIADTSNHRVRRVTASSGLVSTVAGTGVAGYNGDGILATAAILSSPRAVAVDPSTGDVVIGDWGNSMVRRVSAASGIIATVAGNGGCTGLADDVRHVHERGAVWPDDRRGRRRPPGR